MQAALDAEDQAVKKNPKMKLSPLFKDTMAKIKVHLENNVSLSSQEWTEPEVGMIVDKCKALITQKVRLVQDTNFFNFLQLKNVLILLKETDLLLF